MRQSLRFFWALGVPLLLVLVIAHDTTGQQGKQEAVSLTVVNEKGQATMFSGQQLAKLPRIQRKIKDKDGSEATYEGVLLAELLLAAKVALGKELKGPLQANCLHVEAADGYRVIYSLAEVDPAQTDNIVLLADRKDGKPLDAAEGPFRFVVPHDKLHMRWIRQVTVITVLAVPRPGIRDK